MKRSLPFLLLLTGLSLLSGYLLSKASLVGKAGINLFYQQYKFLKVWWQGALLVWGGLLLLFVLHGFAQNLLTKTAVILLNLGAMLVAVTGLYFTYNDFRHTLSYRFLGERFHLGAYLFWVGWILICLFYLFVARKKTSMLDVGASTEL